MSLTVQGRWHETLHSSQSSFSEGRYDIKLCFWLFISVLNEKGTPVPPQGQPFVFYLNPFLL